MKRTLSALLAVLLLCSGFLALSACSKSVGDTIRFGDMRWIVLKVQDGRALVLSEDIVALRPYHDSFDAADWETSDIRRWLNDEFYMQFSEQDRTRIVQTLVTNNNNPWYDTPGGNDTMDHVFLLSLEEVTQWLGDEEQLLLGPPEAGVERSFSYNGLPAQDRIAYFNGEAENVWLRTIGEYDTMAAFVVSSGFLAIEGESFWSDNGIRPALWLEL